MKKIGIITMHKVLNCGSALQAYALQHKIEQLGYKAKIIDYEYPTMYFPKYEGFLGKIKEILAYILKPNSVVSRFKKFYRHYLHLTKTYTVDSIMKKPPMFDVYMTGSDQVWNSRWTNGDTNFFLAFAPEYAMRLSYASSFATSEIDPVNRVPFATELKKYSYITVREQSGVKIVKALTGKEAEVVCDPTLLIGEDEYRQIAKKSKVYIEEPFILVYILHYMFDPYPYVNDIVKAVSKLMKYKVVTINKTKGDSDNNGYIVLNNVGPCEFVWLFANAKFVITTSFHGTAFSVINRCPLLAVVESKETKDGRITTLLRELHQEESIISYKDIPSPELLSSDCLRTKEYNLSAYRERSIRTLKTMLDSYEQ